MNKIDEIKQALAAATPGPWEVVNLGDLHIAKGYRKEGSQHVAQWIAEMYFETDQEEDQAFDDAKLIANAPEYIAYLLKEREKWKKLADAMNLKIYGMATKNLFESPEVGQEGEGNQEEMRHLTPEESESYERSLDKLFNQK